MLMDGGGWWWMKELSKGFYSILFGESRQIEYAEICMPSPGCHASPRASEYALDHLMAHRRIEVMF